MTQAKLDQSTFERATLIRCHLYGATATQGCFVDADLRLADLRQANLTGSNLQNALLSYANLSHAILHDIDFRTADLTGANLTGAQLSGCRFTHEQMANLRLSASMMYCNPESQVAV
jgi:uncharacterized protein YjbI with pentapeptide repeats